MRVEIVKDPAIVNAVANIPCVARLLGADSFDFTEAMNREENVFLRCGEGIALCEWSAPRVYQCHLIFRPLKFARGAIASAIAMRDFMLDRYADLLWGQPSKANLTAIKLILRTGFLPAGDGLNPLVGPVSYFVYERNRQCRHLQ
jgi:hypothetical protein